MGFIDVWVHTIKTPVPYRAIILDQENKGIKSFTVINAIKVLVRKGYIRRAVASSNKTSFVQLRRI